MNNLQNINSIKEKYKFEEYSDEYPELFVIEKKRLLAKLDGLNLKIHHFGSTAIKNVGGKGVIDIFVECAKQDIQKLSKLLTKQFNYEFRISGSNNNRLFHQTEINGRRYHIHLTNFGNPETIKCLAFRDFLNNNPQLAKEYSEIKKVASEKALKEKTKEDMKKVYMDTKRPVIEKIMKLVK